MTGDMTSVHELRKKINITLRIYSEAGIARTVRGSTFVGNI